MAAPNPNNPLTHPTLTGPGYTITGYNTPRPGALFSNRTVGPVPAIAGSHVAYRTTFTAQANQRIRRDIAQNSGVTTFNGWQQGNHPDPTALSPSLHSSETAILADFPTCQAGVMPYNSASTPLVACRGQVTADCLLSQRASYIKAILVHIKGSLNSVACANCEAAASGTGWYGGACSNCIHDNHTARCTVGAGKNPGSGPLYDDWTKKYGSGNRKDCDRNARSRSPDNKGPKLLTGSCCSGMRSNNLNLITS
ncbi:hypothetical protein EJ02DRAFT_516404 [Clathrospora elynae]|uniref:Uncharacterized protein n=1 Tax=Clathrospora elynae TaxID=706981 RepID=A0A6A5S4B7_9PLEO|nr:hypothetical protein EJ02DRAFT_516404 [Clathrospora elynae]